MPHFHKIKKDSGQRRERAFREFNSFVGRWDGDAGADITNKERALKARAKVFLQEPVDNAELLKVIRQALGEPALATKPVAYDLGFV